MDRKSIIVLVLCFGLLLLWSSVIVPKLYPSKPLPPGATNSLSATPSSGAATAPVPAAAFSASTAVPSTGTQWVENTNLPEELLVVSNENARYTFTSYGGGLKLVELVAYPES